jgi:serralysin
MFGGGSRNTSEGEALGFSSHSSSVNQHAVGSSTKRGFQLLYTDSNGNIQGRDAAKLDSATKDSMTLDWTATADTGDGAIAFDQTAFVWHSYGGIFGNKTDGNWTDVTVDAGRDVYWNETRVVGETPAGAGVDVDYRDTATDTWYDTLDAVPKTNKLELNVSLSGTPEATPVVESVETEYRSLSGSPWYETSTEAEWREGSTNNTTVTNDGTLELGAQIGEAGTVTTSDGSWQSISFDGSYDSPVVVGTTNTHNGQSALTFDARSVTSTGAEVRVCEMEGGTTDGCDSHGTETVGYVVVDAAALNSVEGIEAGTFTVDQGIDARTESTSYSEGFSSTPHVFANVQTADGEQPVEARVTSTGTGQFSAGICHTGSTDGCDETHGQETVGWVALEPNNSPFAGPTALGDTGNTVGNSDWTQITFGPSFSETPVVVASTQTDDGGQELQVDEARTVDTSGTSVRYCEIETGDSCDGHTSERVSYLAVEPGSLLTSDVDTGNYTRTIDAGRVVNWTANASGTTTPSSTDVLVNYSTGSGWYEDIDQVDQSRNLTVNITLSSTGSETPVVEYLNVSANATGWRESTTDVDDGNWHHIATSYDGTNLTLYVDGSPERTAQPNVSLATTTVDREIGGEGYNSEYFSGDLDAVRLYDQGLSDAAVEDLYNASVNGTLVTGSKSYRAPVKPGTLSVTNVTISEPANTDVSVFVESDPDGDRSFRERSDEIDIADDSGPYDVTGLSGDAGRYRLVVRLESTSRTSTPTVDWVGLNRTG